LREKGSNGKKIFEGEEVIIQGNRKEIARKRYKDRWEEVYPKRKEDREMGNQKIEDKNAKTRMDEWVEKIIHGGKKRNYY
jgi:hypothetical protein